jgi:hypothetical protein
MNERGWAYWALLILGAFFLTNGVVMLAAPEPWFARVAAVSGPFNPHFVRDVGVAYATSGAAALWAARAPRWRGPLAASAAMFQAGHGAIHVFDVLRGAFTPGQLLEDLPVIYLPAAILIAIALGSLRSPALRA